jgi:FAD/FMN-containing dehydrogenase
MSSIEIVNYDGGITTSPQQLVYPETVEQIQAVLRDPAQYPSPVRGMGSYHSLTPCASSDGGTVIRMSKMDKVISIDAQNQTFTAQAGLQMIDANHALRAQNLQFMLNIEIGNMTLGAAACCHTKDALDGIEFGQVGSYITKIKWVTPTGDLAEASETDNSDLLRRMRTSYGLCGVIYEVTFRVKPIEEIHFTYTPRPIKDLTDREVADFLDNSQGLVCWTIDDTVIFQRREKTAHSNLLQDAEAATRRLLWNNVEAGIGRMIAEGSPKPGVVNTAQNAWFASNRLLYDTLHLTGGITIKDPDKTVDYRQTPQSDRYAFTFWAFPRDQWLANIRAYVEFRDDYFKRTGFRPNMPCGAYHIRKDQNALLSYSYDGDVFSIDPIHAPTNLDQWHDFLKAFNDFAFQRNGVPLLNQSPFVERKHVENAFGQRWTEFSDWVREVDPQGRMLNPYFASLLSQKSGAVAT